MKTPLGDAMHSFASMEGLWLAGRPKQSEVKALESLSDADFWSNSLKTPQCQVKFTVDTRRSDTSSQFRTSYQLESGSVEDAYARPEAKAAF